MNKLILNKNRMRMVHGLNKVFSIFLILFTFFSIDAYSTQLQDKALISKNTVLKQIETSKITVHIKGKTLTESLVEICKLGQVKYGIQEGVAIDENIKYNLNMRDVFVKDALEELLKETNYKYMIYKDVITIGNREMANVSEDDKTGYILISGKIVDQEGKPLAGATILVKGTTDGAISDAEGQFQLNIKKGSTVEFFYAGMKTATMVFEKSEANIKIELESDEVDVDDVIVTGYGTVRRSSFTGNAVVVKGEDLMKVSRTNAIKALSAFDPSIRLSDNIDFGSDPNRFQDVTIRGKSSLGVLELNGDDLSKDALETNPNTPTFILDGFVVSMQKIYDLDVNRIASMVVLKDAAATAVYGSRAANGVIVVTTYPPKPGQVRVSYNMTASVEAPDLTSYNLMNAKEKLEAERLSGIYDWSPESGMDAYDKYRQYMSRYNAIYVEGVDTDWMSLPLRTAFKHNHSVSIEGGNENVRYVVDANFDKNNGVMIGSDRTTSGIAFKLNFNYGKLRISNNFMYDNIKSNESKYGSFSDFSHQQPYSRYKDNDGVLLDEVEFTTGSDVNPMYEASLNNFQNSRSQQFTENLIARYNFTNSFFVEAQVGISVDWQDGNKFTDPKSKNSSTELSDDNLLAGDLLIDDDYSSQISSKIMISYNKTVELHNVNLSLNAEMSENTNNATSTHYVGFPSGTLSSVNYATEVYGKPLKYESTSRNAGVNGLFNYSYDDTYLVDLSFRYEGSSAFGSEKKSAPYWAGGFGVNVHNYEFMKTQSVINTLRLRASYGQIGNVNFPAYAAQTYYETLFDDWYITGYGVKLKYLGNPNLKPEKTNTFDIGFVSSLFDNRVNLTASYYNKTTVDMINDVTISSAAGFTTYKDNLGKVRNEGYELIANASLIRKKDLYLNVYANFSQSKNTMLEIAESLKDYNEKVNQYYQDNYGTNNAGEEVDMTRVLTKYEEGESMTAMYGMKSLGIDPATGKEVFLDRQGNVTYDWQPDQQVNIGDTAPLGEGSLGFNVRYKGYTLDASFSYAFGGDYYNSTLVSYVENADIQNTNVDKRVLTDRWIAPGDITPLKDIADNTETLPTSRFMQLDNYLSLNSLSLQYEFNESAVESLGIERLRLEANCSNLFRIGTIKQERGLSYPFARSFNFTLMINF